MTMSDWTYGVKQGGLMRCCLQSLDEAMLARVNGGIGPPQEGDVLGCRFHDDSDEPQMVFRGGYWQWVGARE